MAAERVTPVDELTGLPLPLIPPAEPLPYDNGDVANWHHHFHPSTNPILVDTLGGRALRTARIQLVDVNHHNYSETAYHQFYKGPPIPEDIGAQFGMCILACAGYIPELAIDLSSGDPKEVPMTEQQIAMLKVNGEWRMPLQHQIARYKEKKKLDLPLEEVTDLLVEKRKQQAIMSYRDLRYGYDPMRKFISSYVLGQDLSYVNKRIRRKFIKEGSEEEGLKLLALASRQAADSAKLKGRTLSELYRGLKEKGRIHDKMPPNAASLIKYKLGDVVARAELLPCLRQQLLATDLVAA